MKEWYILKRGQGLEDNVIHTMTAEDRKWWIQQIQKENEELKKQLDAFMKKAEVKELQVGFVYVSPMGDAGWSYAHDQGRLFIDKMDGVSTSFVEAVPEGPDSERVMLNMARKNYDLIFATSFGYMDPMLKVAGKFPNISFMH